jgi:hypothetical protein
MAAATAPRPGALSPSVITSNPATCDHFKSGQRSRTQDMKLFYRAGAGSGKFCFVSL